MFPIFFVKDVMGFILGRLGSGVVSIDQEMAGAEVDLEELVLVN
jgi:hypothetical protein